MQKNPCHVSSIRSVCGIKAPVIGVFLLINLVIGQPLLALELSDPLSDSGDRQKTTASPAPEQKVILNESKPDLKTSTDSLVDIAPQPVVINSTPDNLLIAPKIDPASAAPEITSTPLLTESEPGLSEEQTILIKELDDLLAQGLIGQEEYDYKKDIILDKTMSPSITPPSSITGLDTKSQTMGKYILPEVSVVDGTLNYAYPIATPPGRAGLNPNLELVYNSANTSQNSLIGIGWSLNIPYIQRLNKRGADKIYNEDPSLSSFISSLDGELVDQGSGVFKPRVENGRFLKYFRTASSWIVIDKNGTIYNFGLNEGSRQHDSRQPAKIFTWFLEKVTDVNGNTISYTYFRDQGQVYPQNISYNQSGNFSLEFVYAPRSQASVSYAPAFRVETNRRLFDINVKINGNLSNQYVISASANNLIQKIELRGYQSNQIFSLPPVEFKSFSDEGQKTFAYESGFTFPTDPVTGKVLVIDFADSTGYYGNSLKDINGDGLLDIVRWTTNKPNGYASQTNGNQIFINNGHGFDLKNDFYFPTDANNKVPVLEYKHCFNGQTPLFYGSFFFDVNGDGLLDIVRWMANKPNGYFTLLSGNGVYINKGNGFYLDENYRLPTDGNGLVLNLDCNYSDYYGNSFKDINGDGRPDIVRWDSQKNPGYSTVTSGNEVFINTGQGFERDTRYTQSLPTSPTNGKVLALESKFSSNNTVFYGNSFMDVNGDGLLDIVRWTAGQPNGYYSNFQNKSGNQVFINNGSEFVLDTHFYLPTVTPGGNVVSLDYNYGPGDTAYGNSFRDINGDGLLDVVRWATNKPMGYSDSKYYSSGNQIFLNTGTEFVLESGYSLPIDQTTNNVPSLDYSSNGIYGNSFQDVNGDDLPDVIRWDKDQGNGQSNLTRGNQVYINTGFGFKLDENFIFPTASNGRVLVLEYKLPSDIYNKHGSSFQDLDGDGLIDVVRWDASYGNGPPLDQLSGNQLLKNLSGRKFIKRIINSYGGEDIFAFRDARQFTDTSGVGLNHELPKGYKPFVVVSHWTDDKSLTGNIGKTTYEYQGAYYLNHYDKPFDKKIAGFHEVRKNTPNDAVIITKYHQGNGQSDNEPPDSYTQIGKVYEEAAQDSHGNLYKLSRFKYQINNLGGRSNSIQLASRLDQVYDGDNTHRDTAEAYSYDTYGNLISRVSYGEVLGQTNGDFSDIGTDNLTETISYATNPVNYVVNRSAENIVFNQSGDKLRDLKIYYDNLDLGRVTLGNPTKTENWKSGLAFVTTKKAYNSYGLVASSTDERGGVTNYAYDTDNLYPTVITNPLNQISRFTYNYLTGQIGQTIDLNGFTYRTDFDVFGRTLRQWIPDPNSDATSTPFVKKTEYQYINSPLNTSVKKKDYLNSDAQSVDTYQYFDGLGRLIQERRKAEKPGDFNVRDLVYNKIGALEKESLLYTSQGEAKSSATGVSTLYINYAYDLLGRSVETTNSVGTIKTLRNDWLTTVIDARGKIKNYYNDAYGNLITVEEHNGNEIYLTNYKWSGNQKLIKITDALNNEREFSYDGLGRRLSAEDLHVSGAAAPTWFYFYDNASNLIKTISPKLEATNYEYDTLNRLVKEYVTSPSNPEFLYSYDNTLVSCLNAKGRLCKVQKKGQDDSNFRYGSNGAVTTENKYIDGLKYTSAYAYDRQGNLTLITYPDNSQVRYVYNNAGLLEKIDRREAGAAFVSVITNFDYSPMGQVTSQIGANGTLSATSVYDDTKLYRLSGKKVVNNEPRTLQELYYQYDANGNITKIIDVSNTLTKKTVNYAYDDLNRLTMASSENVVSGEPYTELFNYDPIGNIIHKSRAQYSYGGAAGANPHAVTQIVNPLSHVQNFFYDANGNMTNKTTSAIVATLKASVNPHGLETTAGFSGQNLNGNSQNIGSGNSPVDVRTTVSGLAPNKEYYYYVFANNSAGGMSGYNFITLSTKGGPAPVIRSVWVSDVTDDTAVIGGEVDPSGRSTEAWYEVTGGPGGGNNILFTRLKDCLTPEKLTSPTLSGLATSTAYQMRIVAKNDMGTTFSAWMPFQTEDTPEPPATLPQTPILAGATIETETPLYLLDSISYSWNYKNQLVGVSNSTSNNSYSYDYTGQRMKASVYEKNTDQTYTRHYPNRFYEVSKTAGTSDQQKKYIYAGNTLIATVKKVGAEVTPTYVYNDHLGGTGVVAGQSGNLLQAVDYYSFGQERICGGGLNSGDLSCDAEKKYIGEYYDIDTTLSYLNARYYDSSIGRFISQDPMFWSPEGFLTDPQSFNSYAYARNNPIIYSDPSGNYVGIDDAAALLIGGTVGVLFEVGMDLATGQKITLGKVAGSFVAGALLGEAALYAPATGGASLVLYSVAAGTLAAGTGNLVEQGLDITTGERKEGFNESEFLFTTAAGGLTSVAGPAIKVKVPGISGGVGNWDAVGKSLSTKAAAGEIKSMSAQTAFKSAIGSETSGILTTAADTLIQNSFSSNSLNNLLNYQAPSLNYKPISTPSLSSYTSSPINFSTPLKFPLFSPAPAWNISNASN